jgi:hypothetical protein
VTLTRYALAAVGVAGCAVTLAACAKPAASSGVTAAGSSPAAASSPVPASPSASISPSDQASPTPSAVTAASSSPPSSSAAQEAGTQECAGSQIAITLTHTGALGGQAGGYLTFTNKGANTCQITGWPSVTGVSKTGASAVLVHAQSTMFGAWQYSSPAPVVALAPGASAYAVVAADDNPAGSATSCPAPYVELRVAAPGSPVATTVSAWLPEADTYLPTCPSVSGRSTDETSDIVPLTSLAH